MSGTWISIERASCARAFAVNVASWAMAMARTMGQSEAAVLVDAGAVEHTSRVALRGRRAV
jgi:hypothetical protein